MQIFRNYNTTGYQVFTNNQIKNNKSKTLLSQPSQDTISFTARSYGSKTDTLSLMNKFISLADNPSKAENFSKELIEMCITSDNKEKRKFLEDTLLKLSEKYEEQVIDVLDNCIDDAISQKRYKEYSKLQRIQVSILSKQFKQTSPEEVRRKYNLYGKAPNQEEIFMLTQKLANYYVNTDKQEKKFVEKTLTQLAKYHEKPVINSLVNALEKAEHDGKDTTELISLYTTVWANNALGIKNW